MLPGTMREVVIPVLGRVSDGAPAAGSGLQSTGVLREGPPCRFSIRPRPLGELNRAAGNLLASLYAGPPGPSFAPTSELPRGQVRDTAWNALRSGFRQRESATSAKG